MARWGRGDFVSLEKVHHPARRLLRQYNHCGAPVSLAKKMWIEVQWLSDLARG